MKDQLGSPNKVPAQNAAPAPVPATSAESGSSPIPDDSAGSPRRVVRSAHAPARRPAKRPAVGPKRPAASSAHPPRPAQPSHSARLAQAGRPGHPTHPSHHYENLVDDGDDGFFARHRTKVIFGIIALLIGGAAYYVKTSKPASEVKAPPQVVSIKLPPLPKPPPPPPPPKVPPPPQEQKMVQETAAEEKPKEEAPKPVEQAAPTLGTGLKGDGEGLAGLGGSGNGGGFGGPRGGGGSKWGWYAGQVQTRVADALRRNNKTKTASMKIQVRIWPDSTGRITRAKLDGTTGDSKLDEALQGVLNGLQLQEPPPPGMPAPIVLRLTARRP